MCLAGLIPLYANGDYSHLAGLIPFSTYEPVNMFTFGWCDAMFYMKMWMYLCFAGLMQSVGVCSSSDLPVRSCVSILWCDPKTKNISA